MWTTLWWPVVGVVVVLQVAVAVLEVCVPGRGFLSRREQITQLRLAAVALLDQIRLKLTVHLDPIRFFRQLLRQAAEAALHQKVAAQQLA
jgi:hypothetical protein